MVDFKSAVMASSMGDFAGAFHVQTLSSCASDFTHTSMLTGGAKGSGIPTAFDIKKAIFRLLTLEENLTESGRERSVPPDDVLLKRFPDGWPNNSHETKYDPHPVREDRGGPSGA